jgi:Na+/H+ antiporter NhaD/arsenite permease-like protein
MPVLRWAPLFLVAAYFVIVFWLFRHYRGRLPRPTQEQKLNAARSIRRLAWFFFAAPILGLLAGWQDIASLPHGVGFLIPLIPILLGAYYLRLSIKLSRTVTDSNTLNQIGE